MVSKVAAITRKKNRKLWQVVVFDSCYRHQMKFNANSFQMHFKTSSNWCVCRNRKSPDIVRTIGAECWQARHEKLNEQSKTTTASERFFSLWYIRSLYRVNQLIRKVTLAWISFSAVLDCGIACIVPSFPARSLLFGARMKYRISGFCDALHTHTHASDPLRYDRRPFQNGPLEHIYRSLLFFRLPFSLFQFCFLRFW